MKATGIAREIETSSLKTLTQNLVFCIGLESAKERYIWK